MASEATFSFDPAFLFSAAGVFYILLASMAIVHVVLNKRNEGAAVGWLGVIILSPFFGVLLYWLFGINRIRVRALAQKKVLPDSTNYDADSADFNIAPNTLSARMGVGSKIHNARYLAGNSIAFLHNGEQAYSRMLSAINNSYDSVVLSSYIFDYDAIGKQFVDALVKANNRGVKVRVLIDGFGIDYAIGMAKPDRVLKKQGVKTARFLSTLFTTDTRFINLRNHRKILSVDGEVAFVGGMNIRDENLTDSNGILQTQDLHFEVAGPVISQINNVFSQDWQFAADESLDLPKWKDKSDSSRLPAEDDTVCRVIVDGPDDNYQKLELSLLAAINSADDNIRIITPYFLPNDKITAALQLAIMKGVTVTVIVPKNNNLRVVGWAMSAIEKKLLRIGVELFHSTTPFDHSKLFVVDDDWVLIGSSNWDARSLELNFEINIECYSQQFANTAIKCFSKKQMNAVQLSSPKDRPFLIELRNNFFRLFSPYL